MIPNDLTDEERNCLKQILQKARNLCPYNDPCYHVYDECKDCVFNIEEDYCGVTAIECYSEFITKKEKK